MKILVTGGLGFIGHHVVAFLEQAGHEVIITDTQTDYGIIPKVELQSLITERRTYIRTDRIYSIDIRDAKGIEWLISKHQPNTIIHLASFPRQKVVNNDPAQGSQTMIAGLLNLLESSVRNHVNRFVYVSSSMVYGDFVEETVDGIAESHATRPKGQYGVMKLAGEWLVQDYHRRGLIDYRIIRPSAVYGPRDVEDRVVSKFLLAAMRGQTLKVNGANEKLDFTHVKDVAQGIAMASTGDPSCIKVYNMTRGQARTLLEAAELCVKIAGQGSVLAQSPDTDFPSRGQLNIQNARLNLQYSPCIDIEQGFQDYYDWLVDHPIYGIKKTV